MNLKKNNLLLAAFIIAGVLFAIIYLFVGPILNAMSATIGMNRVILQTIGKSIACGLRESNAFPRDGGHGDNYYPAGQSNQWHAGFDVAKLLPESGQISYGKIPDKYRDADIWTVIKNIPNDPPPNLVVLATRNVDPSSLRTRLTEKDMDKHIRFKEKKDPLWILNQTAVLVYADGVAFAFRPVTSSSRKPNRATCDRVYRGQPFDLTTNTVNGLQVKYLTPDGEVTPTND